ncbi:autotransporter-associated beta strand repeat-containing protein [Piscinibacter sp. XHJ-5]|uniref:autotransporter-associated beta strand repeat-containing protein n=1 Tax=Piscinibacter sp. XHJ-5 TaxID=3037797 RepID=UPI0024535236|nr:autotransporter-associated beta strand repeat-containing protein [Piscinibacter sp. XHJ-5]
MSFSHTRPPRTAVPGRKTVIARAGALALGSTSRVLLAGHCALAAVSSAQAAVFDVANEAQLRSSLVAAAAGDTIRFQQDITVTAAGGGDLPAVVVSLTIDGNGRRLSGNGENRGLFVHAGAVAVNDLTIANTLAKGGDSSAGGAGAGLGRALFVREGAHVTVSNVAVHASAAQGGHASLSLPLAGGGGLGGNGGTGTPGGGGGIGKRAAGGSGFTGYCDSGLCDGIVTGAAPGGSAPLKAGGTGGGGGAAGNGMGAGGGSVAGGAGGPDDGGAGGFGGGGGTGGHHGGKGGFGGGGGTALFRADGGYGGGGAGNLLPGQIAAGAGGFGGGRASPGTVMGSGGAGAGMGGGVFVMQGGTLIVSGRFTVEGGSVAGGTSGAGGHGEGFGSGFFLQGSGSLQFQPGAGQSQVIRDAIADEAGVVAGGYTPPAGFGTPGSWNITKAGSGVLALAGANLYTGTTTVSAGTLQVGEGGAAGQLGRGTTTIAEGATLAFHRGDAHTHAARIEGAGLLRHTGSGTTTLSGVLDLSGTLSAEAGTLVLANSTNTIGTLRVDGGVLDLSGTTQQAAQGSLSAGTLRNGTLSTSTGFAQSGGTMSGRVAGPAYELSGGEMSGALLVGTLRMTGGTLSGSATASSRFEMAAGLVPGLLSGTADLTKTGSGTLTLPGAQRYTGRTVVDAGELQVTGSLASTASRSRGAAWWQRPTPCRRRRAWTSPRRARGSSTAPPTPPLPAPSAARAGWSRRATHA